MKLNSLNSTYREDNVDKKTVALSTSNVNNKQENDIEIPTAIKEIECTKDMDLADKINYWKDKYKKIYCTTIDDTKFIWRRINRAEYSQCAFKKFNNDSKIDMFEKQYLFCKIGVLYPENIVELMDECAGIAPILSDEIIYKSGFGDAYPKTVEVNSTKDVDDAQDDDINGEDYEG